LFAGKSTSGGPFDPALRRASAGYTLIQLNFCFDGILPPDPTFPSSGNLFRNGTFFICGSLRGVGDVFYSLPLSGSFLMMVPRFLCLFPPGSPLWPPPSLTQALWAPPPILFKGAPHFFLSRKSPPRPLRDLVPLRIALPPTPRPPRFANQVAALVSMDPLLSFDVWPIFPFLIRFFFIAAGLMEAFFDPCHVFQQHFFLTGSSLFFRFSPTGSPVPTHRLSV